ATDTDLPSFPTRRSSDLKSQPVNAPETRVWIGKRAVLISVAIILIATAVTTIYLIRQRRSLQSLSTVTLPQTAGKRAVAVMFFEDRKSTRLNSSHLGISY